MSKKASIITILIVVTAIIGGLLYFYFKAASTTTQNTNPITNTSSGNPFGNSVTNTSNTTTTGGTAQTNTSTGNIKNAAVLTQVYRNPTSGSIFFSNAGSDTLRFVDRGNGNVYEYTPTDQGGQAVRITNTTIPKVQEAIWSANGNNVVYRYLNDTTATINSFSAKISSATSTDAQGSVTGSFLSSNIQELVIDPKGSTLFELLNKNDGSGTIGMSALFDNTNKKQIFDSNITFWNISWPKQNTITFTTKPTLKDFGYLFFFNTDTKAMTKILGSISGLSTVTNPDATLVAYSGNTGNSFTLGIYDVKNKSNRNIHVPTFADKCIWGTQKNSILYCAVPQNIPIGSYPDDWYQGVVSFSDNIWMIDTQTGGMKRLYQIGLKENATVDAYNLQISPDDQYLAFTNKNDLSLWVLNITQSQTSATPLGD